MHEYRVDQVLGVGGFGITYLAWDSHLDKPVAIKEYLPGELATRVEGGTEAGAVMPLSAEREADYRWGLERFLLEARTLARFEHPNIVRVLRYFEANRTAYMVMDYERGEPLKTVLQHNPQPPEALLKELARPLLEGLAVVHAGGFLHRDIKPDNIVVRASGQPVLIDFGAARNAIGGSTRSLTAVLTPGYAPLEQYSGEGKQGPWTDLYAFAGVLYRAVTSHAPPDAVSRLKADTVGAGLAAARGKYSEPFLRAVEWALAVDEKKRPQSVADWQQALFPAKAAKPRRRRWPWVAAAAALIVAIGVLGALNRQRPDEGLEEKFAPQFRAADTNADGFLTPDEVRGRFPLIAKEFARTDTDSDGRISLREFLQVRRMQLERKK
ncbi:MAG TPA: protein kinase [Burkholderiales bacterium]|nr:protein kinase [Burkholderiales bacterium]